MPNWNTQNLGSSILSPAHGLGGAKATILSFLYSVPPSARKKFLPSNQAGEKERGWGKEFSTACSAPQAQWVGKRFRRLALSQTSKQNNFQILLKEKGSREKLKN